MYGAQPTAIRSRWRRSCHQSHSRCLLLQTLAVQRRTQAGGRDHPRAFPIVTLRRQAPCSHFGQADDPGSLPLSLSPATLSLPTTTAASSRSSRPHCDIPYCTLHVALHVTLKGSNCMFLWLLLISFSTVLLEAEADLCGCTLQRTWEQAVQATALEAVGMSKPWVLSLFC